MNLDLNEIKNGNTFADSLTIAEVFGKEHAKVIIVIEKLIADIEEGNLKIPYAKFSVRNYKGSDGKQHRKYLLDRDMFSLLVMGFTGKKALSWKWKYIEAFNKMEAIITEKSSEEWITARSKGKLIRVETTDAIKRMIDNNVYSKNSFRYYGNYTKLIYSLVGVDAGQRDNFTHHTLSLISLLEDRLKDLIDMQIDDGIERNSKETYEYVKDSLNEMKKHLPLSRNKYLEDWSPNE